jgi:hypothetical protein
MRIGFINCPPRRVRVVTKHERFLSDFRRIYSILMEEKRRYVSRCHVLTPSFPWKTTHTREEWTLLLLLLLFSWSGHEHAGVI